LFRCEKCEIFFKSKKGFEGHLQNRHSPKVIGADGRPKSRKEVEGLNKVRIKYQYLIHLLFIFLSFMDQLFLLIESIRAKMMLNIVNFTSQ
jgi:uncharacterized C2H2 Zn-finger protein